MPIVKRAIEPVALSKQSIPTHIRSELECVTNNTLSGVILQLSSLSLHAEDLFGELFTEASLFYHRARKLQDRIDRLSTKVTQLDSSVEEVSLHDINFRRVFRSNEITDQQVVSRKSLSQSIQVIYNKAEKPPPLQELSQFRDDGRDALKIYTDPDYFFNLWRESMQKEMRDAKEKRREQRKKEKRSGPVRKQQKVRQAVPKSKLKAQRMQQGVEFMDTNVQNNQHSNYSSPTSTSDVLSATSSPSVQTTISLDRAVSSVSEKRPPSVKPPPPPQSLMISDKLSHHTFVSPVTELPPPPPVHLDINGRIPSPTYPLPNHLLSPQDSKKISLAPSSLPPPPPIPNNLLFPNSDLSAIQGVAVTLAEVTLKNGEPSPVDSRGGLLSAIRVGINLKKVEQREKTVQSTMDGGNDVASILARRIAIEFSDSESDSYVDDDDDAEWD